MSASIQLQQAIAGRQLPSWLPKGAELAIMAVGIAALVLFGVSHQRSLISSKWALGGYFLGGAICVAGVGVGAYRRIGSTPSSVVSSLDTPSKELGEYPLNPWVIEETDEDEDEEPTDLELPQFTEDLAGFWTRTTVKDGLRQVDKQWDPAYRAIAGDL